MRCNPQILTDIETGKTNFAMASLGVIGDLRYAYTYEWQSDYSKVIPIYASVSATQLTILAL